VRSRTVEASIASGGCPAAGAGVQMGSVLVCAMPRSRPTRSTHYWRRAWRATGRGFGRVAVNWHGAKQYDYLERLVIEPEAVSAETEPTILQADEVQLFTQRIAIGPGASADSRR